VSQQGVPDSSSVEGGIPARPSKIQKGIKRKADTTTSFDEEPAAGPAPAPPAKREARPSKRPPPIDYAHLKPRYKVEIASGYQTNPIPYPTFLNIAGKAQRANEVLSARCQ